MKKTKKKQRKQADNDPQNENPELTETNQLAMFSIDDPTNRMGVTIDAINFHDNYTLKLNKGENDPNEQIVGVRLTKTKQPFFYIRNDIFYEEENDIKITDVFGHKCDVGQVSFTNLEKNGETITLPTDLISSLCPSSLMSYYENQNL